MIVLILMTLFGLTVYVRFQFYKRGWWQLIIP